MLAPLVLRSPYVLQVLANAWSLHGEDVRLMRRRLSPVMGAGWRVPGGAALVMANIHDHPVEFAANLRGCRLGQGAPLHLIGRTFSEDGDVPAASLGASGTDITGRLPRRAIVLVSLR